MGNENKIYLICVDDKGFEDQITKGSAYMLEGFGLNSYKVYNDNEVERWYGESKFAMILPVGFTEGVS